jgi:hypothetical protein
MDHDIHGVEKVSVQYITYREGLFLRGKAARM